jgi:hypothetical protein
MTPAIIMRQLAPLCLLSLLACTTAQPNKPAPPVETREAEVDIEALVARDKLIDYDPVEVEQMMGSGKKELVKAQRVELNGAPPRELIIHTQEYTGEGTWSDTLWIYDVQDVKNPRQLEVPVLGSLDVSKRSADGLTWGSYMDAGWWRAEDLDLDGKAELIILGHSDGVAPAPLNVLGWDDARGMVDRLWRDPGGVDVVIADVDGDGRREIVAVTGSLGEDGLPPGIVPLRGDEQGRWRPMAGELKVWLPRVLEAMIEGKHPRLYLVLPQVMQLMQEHKVAPRDVARLQRELERQIKAGGEHGDEELRWLCDAMAWEGNLAAYDVMLPMVTSLESPQPVIEALLELDARNKQTRGREALLGWLKGALRGELDEETYQIADLLRVMEQRGDGAAAALVAAALGDEALSLDARERLLRSSLRYMPTQQAALWALGGALRPVFLEQLLGELPSYMTGSEPWRAALDVAKVKALMADPATRGEGMRMALYLDPPLREEVFTRFDQIGDVTMRRELLIDVLIADVAPPDLARMTRWMARAIEPEEREALVRWVMQSADAGLQLKLLEQQRDAQVVRGAQDALGAPWCAEQTRDCRAGALLKELPALHKIMATRVRSKDASVREAALVVMGQMPHEPTQRLLLEIARQGADEAMRSGARNALLNARSPIIQDYLIEELSRAPEDYDLSAAYAAVMDEAGAQRVVDGLIVPEKHYRALWQLSMAAPRVCAPRQDGLEALFTGGSLGCGEQDVAASALALCAPAWLTRLASDEELRRCEGGALKDALVAVGDRGTAAHIPALEALSEDSRSRPLREAAASALVQLRERLSKPAP